MKSLLSKIQAMLVAFQRAQVAAHFARTGNSESAKRLMLKD